MFAYRHSSILLSPRLKGSHILHRYAGSSYAMACYYAQLTFRERAPSGPAPPARRGTGEALAETVVVLVAPQEPWRLPCYRRPCTVAFHRPNSGKVPGGVSLASGGTR